MLWQDPHGALRASADTERRIDGEVARVLKEAYGRVTTLLVRAVIPHPAVLTLTPARPRLQGGTCAKERLLLLQQPSATVVRDRACSLCITVRMCESRSSSTCPCADDVPAVQNGVHCFACRMRCEQPRVLSSGW